MLINKSPLDQDQYQWEIPTQREFFVFLFKGGGKGVQKEKAYNLRLDPRTKPRPLKNVVHTAFYVSS